MVLCKLRTMCEECGDGGLFLDRPQRSVRCLACHIDVEIEASRWGDVLETATDDDLGPGKTAIGGLGISQRIAYEMANVGAELACPSCRATLPSEWIAGSVIKGECSGCRQAIAVEPVPPWLADVLPRASHLVIAGDEQHAVATPKPVLMNCIQCGAALEVGQETTRISTCAYCQSDYYVPVDVWRRLHPARRRRTWGLVLDAVTADQPDATPAAPTIACATCGASVPQTDSYLSGDGNVCARCFYS